MQIRKISFTAILMGCVWLQSASAAITFDLSTDGIAGAALEGGATSFTQSGLTIGVVTTSSLAGATGSEFSADGNGAGVDSTPIADPSGGASRLDSGESLRFVVSYSSSALKDVELASIDFRLQEGNQASGDQIFATIAGTPFEFFTGALPGQFNNNQDTFTPTLPLAFSSGDSIELTAGDQFQIQSITFNATAVPEPSFAIVLGLVGVVYSLGRKRQRAGRTEGATHSSPGFENGARQATA